MGKATQLCNDCKKAVLPDVPVGIVRNAMGFVYGLLVVVGYF